MSVINFIVIFVTLGFLAYSQMTRKQLNYAFFTLVVLTLITAINVIVYFLKVRERNSRIKSLDFLIDDENGSKIGSVSDFKLPMAFLADDGKFITANSLLQGIFSDRYSMKKELDEIYQVLLKNKIDNTEIELSSDVEFCGRSFLMLVNLIKSDTDNDSYLIMIYFIEKTDYKNLETVYRNRQTAIAIIAVDSYEEIYQTSGEAVANEISVELGKLFEKWLEGTDAIIKKMIRDRYILIIEDKALSKIESDSFSVLNDAKKIYVGNRIPVSLSIGIGARGNSVADNYMSASQALDLALSRGGDQAVVRIDGKDSYFGGSSIEVESLNKVKARVIASLLEKEISSSSRVLIMGHKFADLDSLGSTLCIYRACSLLGIKANIVLSGSNPSIDAVYTKLMSSEEYRNVFIDTDRALIDYNDNPFVIVVDTSRKSMTECPRLLEFGYKLAVFDHHRKSSDYLKDTVIDYSETYASSTSELLLEVLQYMFPNIAIPVIEAEIIYSGIIVDTKNFVFNTGSRTFEVASFLKAQGINTVAVRKYFQPDMETYSSISRIISEARMIGNKVAVAVCPQGVKNAGLVTPIACDKLLDISGVEASFVINDRGGQNVSISGRSLGEINVQVILEKLGGGGHLTAAGANLDNVSLEYAEKLLVGQIQDYIKI